MIDIDKIERRILDYIETNDEYTDTYLEDCLVILKEVRALREVADAARDEAIFWQESLCTRAEAEEKFKAIAKLEKAIKELEETER